MSCHVIVMLCHVMPCLCHAMPCHVMPCHCHAMPCPVMSCHVISCHVMPCHCHDMPCHAMALSCHVMPCHAMSLSRHAMSCHVMSCHVMAWPKWPSGLKESYQYAFTKSRRGPLENCNRMWGIHIPRFVERSGKNRMNRLSYTIAGFVLLNCEGIEEKWNVVKRL